MGDILTEVEELFLEVRFAVRIEAVGCDFVERRFPFDDGVGGVGLEAVVPEAEAGGADEELDGAVSPTSKGQEGGEGEGSLLPVVHEDGVEGGDWDSIAERRRIIKVRQASSISWMVRFGRWTADSSTSSGVSARLRRT